jgi:hypothetical protein
LAGSTHSAAGDAGRSQHPFGALLLPPEAAQRGFSASSRPAHADSVDRSRVALLSSPHPAPSRGSSGGAVGTATRNASRTATGAGGPPQPTPLVVLQAARRLVARYVGHAAEMPLNLSAGCTAAITRALGAGVAGPDTFVAAEQETLVMLAHGPVMRFVGSHAFDTWAAEELGAGAAATGHGGGVTRGDGGDGGGGGGGSRVFSHGHSAAAARAHQLRSAAAASAARAAVGVAPDWRQPSLSRIVNDTDGSGAVSGHAPVQVRVTRA